MRLKTRVLFGVLAMSVCSAAAAEGTGGGDRQQLERLTTRFETPQPRDPDSGFLTERSASMRRVAFRAGSAPQSAAESREPVGPAALL